MEKLNALGDDYELVAIGGGNSNSEEEDDNIEVPYMVTYT